MSIIRAILFVLLLQVAGVSQAAVTFGDYGIFPRQTPLRGGPSHGTIADVNGDGRVDSIGHQSISCAFYLFLGNGQGGWRNVSLTHVPKGDGQIRGYFATPPFVIDIDRDGDLDVVMPQTNGANLPAFAGLNALFLNDGSGHFTNVSARMERKLGATISAHSFDANGDGWPDLLFVNTDCSRRLLLSSAAGHKFKDVSSTHLPATYERNATMAAVGDFDGDKDIDFVVVRGYRSQTSKNSLYINDGTGCFTEKLQGWPTPRDASRSVDVGDIDGDGDLDLVVGNRYPVGSWVQHKNRFYINDGKANFRLMDVPKGSDKFPTEGGAVFLRDFDVDGDLDLFVRPRSGRLATKYFRNDGNLKFVDATGVLFPKVLAGNFETIGDFDGDGDLDIFMNFVPVGGWLGNAAPFMCLHRHIYAAAPPSIGQNYELELYARKGLRFGIPLLAAAVRRQAIGALGTLWTDLSTLIVGSPLSFRQQNKQVFKLPIPALPQLRGVKLVWQGFILDAIQPERSGFTGSWIETIR